MKIMVGKFYLNVGFIEESDVQMAQESADDEHKSSLKSSQNFQVEFMK